MARLVAKVMATLRSRWVRLPTESRTPASPVRFCTDRQIVVSISGCPGKEQTLVGVLDGDIQ